LLSLPSDTSGETKDESNKNMSDPISDMLTRIRNAGAAQLPTVELPHSRIKESVAKVLQAQGYITDVVVAGETKKND